MAAAAVTAPPIIFPPDFLIKPSLVAKKDIQAELNYALHEDAGKTLITDLRGPDASENSKQFGKRKTCYSVQVHDIRGEETKYTLDRNGFQYVWDPVAELDDWFNEEKCKAILVPKAEKLVQQMYVVPS
jgi:hypothetical protein